MIPHCVRNDGVRSWDDSGLRRCVWDVWRRGDGGDWQSPLHWLGALAPPLLSAEGWVAFGAAGLFVAGQVAYFG